MATDHHPPWLSRDAAGAWLIRVKAVPNASRDEVAGVLGDRLKVRVAAPPEAGKANVAICKMIARRLGVPVRAVTLAAGAASPEKTLAVRADTPTDSIRALSGV